MHNAKSTERNILRTEVLSPGLQKAEDIWHSYNGFVKRNGEGLPNSLVEYEQL